MLEKDPLSYSVLTYVWVIFLASWGGVVSFLTKIKKGAARPFNVMELLGEMATSAFAGMLTFFLCESGGMSQLMTAALVGISGHMGSRAIWHLERWAESRLVDNSVIEDEK